MGAFLGIIGIALVVMGLFDIGNRSGLLGLMFGDNDAYRMANRIAEGLIGTIMIIIGIILT